MQKDNRLFDYINYLLKQTKDCPKDYNPPIFVINRWLSMINTSIPKFINLSVNKWFTVNREIDVTKIYYLVLPKISKKITYIKKNPQSKHDEDFIEIAKSMECSKREVEFLNNALEELSKHTN